MAQKNGFTLIEVVVALAVLGIGLVILIELFSGGLRLGKASVEYGKAVGYSRMKLEEVLLAKELQEGLGVGAFDQDYRWEVGVKRIELLPPAPNPDFRSPADFYQIRVAVFWKSGMRERTAVVESYKMVKIQAKGGEVVQ